MAPVEVDDDYYAVLEISNTATLEVITKSYRRLAKIRHPDKNRRRDSTAVFQLVSSIIF
jgi:curved DNA-binding protein CbpA